jgi:hypothetical protein
MANKWKYWWYVYHNKYVDGVILGSITIADNTKMKIKIKIGNLVFSGK